VHTSIDLPEGGGETHTVCLQYTGGQIKLEATDEETVMIAQGFQDDATAFLTINHPKSTTMIRRSEITAVQITPPLPLGTIKIPVSRFGYWINHLFRR
jgi:hypothetical protein